MSTLAITVGRDLMHQVHNTLGRVSIGKNKATGMLCPQTQPCNYVRVSLKLTCTFNHQQLLQRQ